MPFIPTRNMLKMASATVLLISMTGLPLSAHAIDANRIDTSVKIKQSDLETQDGVVRVYETLTKRAVKACKNRNRKTTDRAKATEICEAQILGDFVRRIDNSDLTEYHQIQQE